MLTEGGRNLLRPFLFLSAPLQSIRFYNGRNEPNSIDSRRSSLTIERRESIVVKTESGQVTFGVELKPKGPKGTKGIFFV